MFWKNSFLKLFCLTIAVLAGPHLSSSKCASPFCLSPSSFLQSSNHGSSFQNQWEIITEGTPYYAPGELQQRIDSIRKAVPLVKDALQSRLNIDPMHVEAIFATGEYILDPSWGMRRPLAPQSLDFIVVVHPLAWKGGDIEEIRDIEIIPDFIFDSADLGYASAYHMNLTVIPSFEFDTDVQARAHYLGCLVDGINPWREEPSLASLQKLIRDLMTETVEEYGTFDVDVWSKRFPAVKLLMDRILPQAIQEEFKESSLKRTPEILRQVQALFASPLSPSIQEVEASL